MLCGKCALFHSFSKTSGVPSFLFSRSVIVCLSLQTFRSYAHEARVLINNAAVIESSLQELAPSFVTCFSYNRISDPDQANRVAEFVMPTTAGAEHFAKILLQVAGMISPTSAIADNVDNGEAMMSRRLQQKMNKIERDRC